MKTWVRNVLVLAVLIASILAGWMLSDRVRGEASSLDARIALLERQMKKKLRPVINIERAAFYSTDGEIVIEEVSRRGKSGKR